ncbi:MAG: hypothetical protein IJ724_13700, partial [Muribaculaceae bacterium]|nr:hypothetical protein [Muribaculaceae bacterium]
SFSDCATWVKLRVMRMGETFGCLPPLQGLDVGFVPVTGVALTLHPGLWSASPSGLLLAII